MLCSSFCCYNLDTLALSVFVVGNGEQLEVEFEVDCSEDIPMKSGEKKTSSPQHNVYNFKKPAVAFNMSCNMLPMAKGAQGGTDISKIGEINTVQLAIFIKTNF